jgi:hypothetical protein
MKTITLPFGQMVLDLTDERRRRISHAIIETYEHLFKELAYSDDLQNKERIAEYRQHIAKLQAWLN